MDSSPGGPAARFVALCLATAVIAALQSPVSAGVRTEAAQLPIHPALAQAVTAALLPGADPGASALAIAEAAFANHRSQIGKGLEPSMAPLLDVQETKLDAAGDLIEIAGSDEDPFDNAIALTERLVATQATVLGYELASQPDRLLPPTAAARKLVTRHGGTPSSEQSGAIASLDELAPPLKAALGRVLGAFLTYEAATRRAYADLDPVVLERLTERSRRVVEEVSAQDGSGSNSGDSVAFAQGRSSAPAPLEELGVDLAPVLAAYLPLLGASSELRTVLMSAAGGASTRAATSQASSACEPLVDESPALLIDLCPTENNRYETDYALAIDAGGNDTYLNNAGGGGSCLLAAPTRPPAAALIDVSGNDIYGDPEPPFRCGTNGGGMTGTGMLVDADGDDSYTGGDGTNGGGSLAGTGMLIDAAGDDSYTGRGNLAANGGAIAGGVGMMVDRLGDDSYRGSSALNGGGAIGGAGALVDGTGDDSYSAGGTGTNGGANTGSSGLLLDAFGDDTYSAGGNGTNGGGRGGLLAAAAAGLLVDVTGDDSYSADEGGTNGGGWLGFGALIDATGNDSYSARFQGTNGGGFQVGGAGTLVDVLGDDSYSAGDKATNGGADGGSGTLVDVVGDDSFLGGRHGSNGGVPEVGSGLLLVGEGIDLYEDPAIQPAGATRDCTVIPKGSAGGKQIDIPSTPQLPETCAPITTAPKLWSTPIPNYPTANDVPRIHLTAPPGASVLLYDRPRCIGDPVARGSAGADGLLDLSVPVPDDSKTAFVATATSAGTDTSMCSRPLLYVEDSTPPILSIDDTTTEVASTTPTFSGDMGTAEHDDLHLLVNIYVGDTASGSPWATYKYENWGSDVNDSRRWSVTVPAVDALTPGGVYTIEAVQQDDAFHATRIVQAFSVSPQATSVVSPAETRPRITGIQPAHGSATGLTPEGVEEKITLTGENLEDVTEVHFGNAGSATVIPEESGGQQVTVVLPPNEYWMHSTDAAPHHVPGTVRVIAKMGGTGTARYAAGARSFTYCMPGHVELDEICQSSISALVPSSGPSFGGTEVVITGRGFEGAKDVDFGAVKAPYFRVESDSRIVAVAPPAPAETFVDVRVRLASGGLSSGGETSRFTYEDRPPRSALITSFGPRDGFEGNEVVIEGKNLYPAELWFGDVRAESLSWHSEDLIVGRAPGHVPGPSDVQLRKPSGDSVVVGSFLYGAHGWVEAGQSEPRIWHSATLLEGPECKVAVAPEYCGQVLLAGGASTRGGKTPFSESALSTSEIYDPATGKHRPLPAMAAARLDHTATMLDGPECRRPSAPAYCGKVLVVGGVGSSGVRWRPHDVRGEPADPAVELFDPSADNESDTWRSHAAGDCSEPAPDCPGYLFAPAPAGVSLGSDQVVEGVGLTAQRFDHTATLLDGPECHLAGAPGYCGKVLVVGGSRDAISRAPMASVLLYDPASGTWAPGPRLDTCIPASASCSARTSHSATPLADGRVLVAGGLGPGRSVRLDLREVLATVQIYDPAGGGGTGAWSPTGSLAQPRLAPSATLLDGPECSATGQPSYCGAVLVAGGFAQVRNNPDSDRPYESAELFFPDRTNSRTPAGARGAFEATGNMRIERGGHTATLLPDGRVLVAGSGPRLLGEAESPRSSSAELFDPPTGDWTYTSFMRTPRGGHAATLVESPQCSIQDQLQCRTVLVTGGSVSDKVYGATPGTGSAELYVPPPEVVPSPSDPGIKATGVLGTVADLSAEAKGPRVIELFFTAADDGNTRGAARYVIKQSNEPITATSFDEATSLCDGVCSFDVSDRGDRISLLVEDLKASTTYHYAVKALDEAGKEGPMSNVASATTDPDTIAPDAVTDLSASALSGAEISLAFSAPASDAGAGPPVTDYVIKQSRAPITDATFDDAKTLCEGTCRFTPAAVGEKLSLSVTGLESSTTYHYALKAIDEGANTSPISNVASATTSSVTPGKVKELRARARSMARIVLSFEAADDGTGEAATNYVIKQSRRPIRGQDDFSDAKTLCGEFCRFDADGIGERVRLGVAGLAPDTTYHYAIRALDDSGNNFGARSQSVKATTLPDRIVPGKVDDLKARALSDSAVKLFFSAVASNGDKGPVVTTYIIKQSTSPIRSAKAFTRAQSLCGKLCSFDVDDVGDRLTLKITDLRPATTYYYAIRAADAGSNRGARSDLAKARTRADG